MDAIKYVKAQKRMFLSGNLSVTRMMEDTMDPELLVNDVERWAAEHPSKTRQELFLEQYPKVTIYHGLIGIRPCQMEDGYTSKYCTCDSSQCVQCRKEYWLQEVE